MILEWICDDFRNFQKSWFFIKNVIIFDQLARCPRSRSCSIETESGYYSNLDSCANSCPPDLWSEVIEPTPWGPKFLRNPARGWPRFSILDPSEDLKKEEGECFAPHIFLWVPLCSQHSEFGENGVKSGSQLTLNRLFSWFEVQGFGMILNLRADDE